ncbi:MAG: hypothetical protein M1833_001126 [Piccolia ochrophora]|nr:MAG: hypothetical protein M1833_001126 [Piccolia ochrophora]
MADIQVAPHFGAELKDAYKPVNAWVASGIAWIDDIQQFYRDRSVIEREYAAKLNALAKKYLEKKGKKISSLSVGDTPTMTPGSLESASLTTWNTQLTTLESRAAEHERLATEFVAQVADPLKHVSARYEEIRKRHAEYAVKLEKERDASYAELKRVKGSYDVVCQDVESRRKKVESAFDSGKQKAQNAYHQQTLDMNNVKNTYLISINVTNTQKQKYYHEYVPELLNSLQDLSETRITKLNALWTFAAQLESSCLTRSVDHLNNLLTEIPRNDPKLDSMMFVRHNVGAFQEPPDMRFEPSPVWHDDATMIVDEDAKVFLRNIMGKSKGQLTELGREYEKKRKELDGVKRTRQTVREGRDKRDEVEIVTTILSFQEELHRIDHKRLTVEVETATIKAAVGDVTLGAKNHGFRAQTFKIPTNCDLCGERIWGLSAKGFDCKDCGYTCHGKCELKVPATCPGEQTKEEKKKLKTERQDAAHTAPPSAKSTSRENVAELSSVERSNTMNSLSSGYAASAHRSVSGLGSKPSTEETSPERGGIVKAVSPKPREGRKNRIVAPPPTQYAAELPEDEDDLVSNQGMKSGEARGKMLYAYQANGEGEITVDDGVDVTIVEPDDGSGWIGVRAGRLEGIVPAAYVELSTAELPVPERPSSTYSNSSASLAGSSAPLGKKKGPAVAPKRGAKKLAYVEALYDYEARSDVEWSMDAGEKFVLINKDAGEGWADVEKGGIVKSVPANYIEDVP